MSLKAIKTILLIEDNFADVRLLREMFSDYGEHGTPLMHVDCVNVTRPRVTISAGRCRLGSSQ